MPIVGRIEGQSGVYRFAITNFTTNAGAVEQIVPALDRLAIVWGAGSDALRMTPNRRAADAGFEFNWESSTTDVQIWLRCTHWPLTAMEWWTPSTVPAMSFTVMEIW